MSLSDYWATQRVSAKRRKTDDGSQSLPDRKREAGTSNPLNKPLDTPDSASDGGSPRHDVPPSSQTDFESSLPAVPDEAVEYESDTDDRDENRSLHERLENGRWQKWKSSIYLDAFILALETVLEEETHLFNEAEMEVFRQWKELPYESQYLYVRLFLRKTSAWHRINRLGHYSDVTDLPSAVADLRRARALPDLPESLGMNSGKEQHESLDPSGHFRFADSMEEITTLEEASSLLMLHELKLLAKEAKLEGRSKKELLAALSQSSQTQTSFGWRKPENASNRDNHFMSKVFDHTGDCIRLASGPRALFERVHLVFYKSTEWTEKSLTTIILAKMSRKNFPEYIVSRSSSIFPSRQFLLEFESALRTQYQIDNILESGGTSTEMLQQVKKLSDGVYPRWKALLEQEQQKEETIYEYGEGAYLRRFSPAWVYTRIIHKGLQSLARFKEYKREHEVLSELLAQRLFHAARRGGWYQRKALLEEHYMWSLSPFDDRSEDNQRKYWKRIAVRTCEEGLEDTECHLTYHFDLQKRITKLEKALKVVKREQHDFGHVMLVKPEERIVEGIRVEQELAGYAGSKPAWLASNRGRPTVWVDERNGGDCRVESMCMNWYSDHGWKGYHSEGGIVRTLFGYLFYDILFTYVPNVFQTPFQTCPLDLHTDAFYVSRASEINHRVVEITNGAAERIIRDVHARESPKQTCAVGLDWSFELDDLVEIAQCFRGEALATVCKVLAQEYQQRGGGIPDLFLWRLDRKEVMFVEVKSENDRLSDTQRLWIHVLIGAGVRVELCNAVAREVRLPVDHGGQVAITNFCH